MTYDTSSLVCIDCFYTATSSSKFEGYSPEIIYPTGSWTRAELCHDKSTNTPTLVWWRVVLALLAEERGATNSIFSGAEPNRAMKQNSRVSLQDKKNFLFFFFLRSTSTKQY